MRTRAYRFSGNTPAFPAQWLYGLYVLTPAIRICLSPSPREYGWPAPGWAGFASAGLDANPEAVRPTRFHRTQQRRSSARRPVAHGVDPALLPPACPTLPRPP